MGNILDCSSDPHDAIHKEDDIEDHVGEATDAPRDAATLHTATTDLGTTYGTQSFPRVAASLRRESTHPLRVLERKVPLRDSQLWRMQRDFYVAHGVALAFIRDCLCGNKVKSEPVYIVEVGSGHGKFSFLFLRALLEMKEFIPHLEGGDQKPAFLYVVTDISPMSLDFIASHPAMREYVKMGVLDVALLDAESPEIQRKLDLQLSSLQVDLTLAVHPVLAICNYVFDSLLMDAFKFSNGVLHENLVTVSTGAIHEDLPSISDMTVQWELSRKGFDSKDSLGYYGLPTEGAARGHLADKDFNPVLASYFNVDERLEGQIDFAKNEDGIGSILMPLGALRFLRSMKSWSNGRAVALVGDKGYSVHQEMRGGRDPHIAAHGSFSCMVNFDALARYTKLCGGFHITSPYQEGFKCQALVFGMQEEAILETILAWREACESFGPESFTTLQRAIKDDIKEPSLRLIHSLLKLSDLDPDVFYKCKNVLVSHMSHGDVSMGNVEDIRKSILGVSERVYHLHPAKDIHFEAARLLMAIKDFSAALQLFEASEEVCGRHHVTHHNKGMCHFYKDEIKEAILAFNECLALQPDYDDARHWRAHAERLMQSSRNSGDYK